MPGNLEENANIRLQYFIQTICYHVLIDYNLSPTLRYLDANCCDVIYYCNERVLFLLRILCTCYLPSAYNLCVD